MTRLVSLAYRGVARFTARPVTPRVFGLDVMRAVAIAGVLMTHAQFLLPRLDSTVFHQVSSGSGAFGVELFFVLSGFLIGSILLSLSEQFDTLHVLPHFWARRWLRTLPAYLVCLGMYYAVYLALGKEIPSPWLYVTFTQNWLQPHPKMFPQAWSLSVEEWFYLLFPASLFFVNRVVRSFRWAFLVAAAAFLVIPTLVRVQWALADGHPSWDEDFRKVMFVRLDAIMFGVIMALFKTSWPRQWLRLRIPLLAVGGALLVGSWSAITHPGLDDSVFAKTLLFSQISLGFACLLPVCDQWDVTRESFLTRAVRLLALWSYSLYLCNLLIVQALRFIQVRIQTSALGDLAFFTTFFVMSLAASSVLYTLIERPFMNLRERLPRRLARASRA